MKLINLIAVLCFCSSIALAETTVEMVRQRAEAGDAAAQSVMGMMANYGYKVPKDNEAAQEWYQKAAAQGDFFSARCVRVARKQAEASQADSFATENLFTAKKKREVPPAGSSNNPSSNADPWGMSKATLEKKVSNASSAEYKGDVKVDELVLNRAGYIGKVVELKFNHANNSSIHPSWVFLRNVDEASSGPSVNVTLCGQQALEWATKQSKKGRGVSGKVYVLVDDERNLIALGTRQSSGDNGYAYSW